LFLTAKMAVAQEKWDVAFAECNITYLIRNIGNKAVRFANILVSFWIVLDRGGARLDNHGKRGVLW